jgi:adenylate kinase
LQIILLGPPGVGKGTQAKSLAKELNLPHISTGDILRMSVKENTELGKEAKEFMKKGELVPDQLVNQMLIERINRGDTDQGYILDGYPRNVAQANKLEEILKHKFQGDYIAIYLDASESVIIERLSGRRVCSNCQAVYHIKNMPPKIDAVCDYCQGELKQRLDDQEATIKNRLKVYLSESSPVLEYYKTKGKLHPISADGPAGIVLDQMLDLVNKKDKI